MFKKQSKSNKELNQALLALAQLKPNPNGPSSTPNFEHWFALARESEEIINKLQQQRQDIKDGKWN